ncbi:MAG: FecR domain-containing protein [Bacteroidia bacterium]|nr:FecR domain-containing protein [Bacteroidia bacterium]
MENNQQNIDYILLLTKYLDNEATKEEQSLLEFWKQANPSNDALFKEYQKIYSKIAGINPENQIDINAEWGKLSSKITFEDSKIIELAPRRNQLIWAILKVAAVIILLSLTTVGVYLFTNKGGNMQFSTGNEIAETTLPDGTKVTLNKYSSIQFSKQFNEKTRNVTQTGDAFFDVTSDKSKPFQIKAGEIIIEVLGTSFYIDAGQENEKIEVIVKTGNVAVYQQNDTTKKIMLVSGNKGTFLKNTGELLKSLNDDINYLAWKTRELIFNNTPLYIIIETLNRTYKSEIIIKSENIKNCRMTGPYLNKTLDYILENLKAGMDLKIEKKGATIEIYGDGC